ncbi:MAG: hypothetical protein IJ305_06080, partial [Oscillospiraceae bacterium]|nr:hypothetical protein [Oscillospiraceae bacterium]
MITLPVKISSCDCVGLVSIVTGTPVTSGSLETTAEVVVVVVVTSPGTPEAVVEEVVGEGFAELPMFSSSS